MYSFSYQNQQYSVVAEVLFALLVEEFKSKIQNNCFIYSTLIDVPKEYRSITTRINNSLNAIGIVGLKIDTKRYDYKNQFEILKELIKRKYDHMRVAEQDENTEISTQPQIDHLLLLNKYCNFNKNLPEHHQIKFKFENEEN